MPPDGQRGGQRHEKRHQVARDHRGDRRVSSGCAAAEPAEADDGEREPETRDGREEVSAGGVGRGSDSLVVPLERPSRVPRRWAP
jgi:hypothetical protein